jgi:hypothetical protein
MLREFAGLYFECLSDIVSALPKRAPIPACFTATSFVIACADIRGKIALDIISRNNLREIHMNGKPLSPVSANQPAHIIRCDLNSIEEFLFPQDDRRTSVSCCVGERNVVLDGLAFSNKEYNEKYWKDAKFYRNTSGSIPFSVDSPGSMLGLDLLWGAELSGRRRERLFEFIKIYGNNKMIPANKDDLLDEVFRDFAHAVSRLRKRFDDWKFSEFLSALGASYDKNVLLLGSYKSSDDDFAALKAALAELGYHAFLLKDSPDMPVQTNLEKLLTAIICSCFIIVLDKEASGHIAEMENMLQYHFRPVIVLREQPNPTTAFLEDRLLTNEFFRVAVISHISPSTLLPFVHWARDLVDKYIKSLDSINHWRH